MTEETKDTQFKPVGFHILIYKWLEAQSGEMVGLTTVARGPKPYLDTMFDLAEVLSGFILERDPANKESVALAAELKFLTEYLGPYPDGFISYAEARMWRKPLLVYFTAVGLIKPGERESNNWVQDHFDEIDKELRA